MKPKDHQYVVRTLMALRNANWMKTRQELLNVARDGNDSQTLMVATHAREALTKNGFDIDPPTPD